MRENEPNVAVLLLNHFIVCRVLHVADVGTKKIILEKSSNLLRVHFFILSVWSSSWTDLYGSDRYFFLFVFKFDFQVYQEINMRPNMWVEASRGFPKIYCRFISYSCYTNIILFCGHRGFLISYCNNKFRIFRCSKSSSSL